MQLRTESDNTHIETAKRASYGGQGELINSISWNLLWAWWLVPEAAVVQQQFMGTQSPRSFIGTSILDDRSILTALEHIYLLLYCLISRAWACLLCTSTQRQVPSTTPELLIGYGR